MFADLLSYAQRHYFSQPCPQYYCILCQADLHGGGRGRRNSFRFSDQMISDTVRVLFELKKLGVRKAEILRLMLLSLAFAVFEGVGIGLLLPVLQYAEGKGGSVDAGDGAMLSRVLEILSLEGSRYVLPALLFIAFVPVVIRSALQYFRDTEAARIRFKVASALRCRGASAIIFSRESFLRGHSKGEMLNSLTAETDRAAEAIASRMVFMNGALLLGIYLVLLFAIAPSLTLLCLLAAAPVSWIFRRHGKIVSRLSVSVSDRYRAFSRGANEFLSGIVTVKMKNGEKSAVQELEKEVDGIRDSMFRLEKLRILVESTMFPFVVLLAFLVIFIAVGSAGIGIAGLSVFMYIMVRLVPQLTLMNSMWSHMHGCMGSFENLDRFIRGAEARRERQGMSGKPEKIRSAIEFAGVDFSYPESKVMDFELKDIRCRLPAGSLTAIVGPSGAGKSTLVRLLTAFEIPQKGDILFDGISLQSYPPWAVRRMIALVPQEPFLFNDTIRMNLTYGLNPDISDRKVKEVLGICFEKDFLEGLTAGLDTVVGEGGQLFSLGQAQRLVIAQAILAEPEVLILDEPTSALDSESEERIRGILLSLKGSMTIVVIAHRFTTIRDADQVLLLGRGRIRGQGRHEDLLRDNRMYRKLFERQRIV